MSRPSRLAWGAAALCVASAAGAVPPAEPLAQLDRLYPELEALYLDLHAHPELSGRESKTAAKLAERLRRLGFEVTTSVGGEGLVGLLRNGSGPTVMLRTDLDGLPVEERTGLPYASREVVQDDSGAQVHVMHACGHDVHMTAWIGTAALLAGARQSWRGTLLLVGQPAEETGVGARAMLAAGLFERFPKPDFAVAIHDSPDLEAGRVGLTAGFALANVDSVDITVHGVGGHGAYPQATVDPVLIASRIVVTLQSIVARENNPLDPAVITVGSIHGGTKHNVIPDEVRLQLTVRSYRDEVRRRLLAAIERVAKAEAAAAAAPQPPDFKVSQGTPATFNDPPTTSRLGAALRRALGESAVTDLPPVMGGEDFSEFGRAGVPAVVLWVGAVEPEAYRAAKAEGRALPSLHSPLFAPDRERTLRTAVRAEAVALLELLGRP
ncbi:MAG TPA: amidohydrolase [Candidatus Polarisedimenticolaceae bacterium]|nr:amidohydrolase [Candidatus Polarisedimenticolaceae bacterium]